MGREVARLLEGRLEAGSYSAVWKGTNTPGAEAPNGLYIARLVTPKFTKSVKMLLLK